MAADIPNDFVKFKVTTFNEFQVQFEKGLKNISKKANLNFSESVAFCLHNMTHQLKINYTFIRIALITLFFVYCTLCALCFTWTELAKWQQENRSFRFLLNQQRNITTQYICEKLKIRNCDAKVFTKAFEDYEKFLVKHINFAQFEEETIPWTFRNAFGFVLSIFFTTGDTPLTPLTDTGRILCCIFPILGIPLFLTVTVFYGRLLNQIFTWAYHKIIMKKCVDDSTEKSVNQVTLTVLHSHPKSSCKIKISHCDCMEENENGSSSYMATSALHEPIRLKKSAVSKTPAEENHPLKPTRVTKNAELARKSGVAVNEMANQRPSQENYILPIKIALIILYAYIAVGSIILHVKIGWDYIAAFYYLHLTFTTTGIGDMHPGDVGTLFHSVYVFFGFILAAMVLESIRVYLTENFRSGLEKVSKYLNVKVLSDDIIMIPQTI